MGWLDWPPDENNAYRRFTRTMPHPDVVDRQGETLAEYKARHFARMRRPATVGSWGRKCQSYRNALDALILARELRDRGIECRRNAANPPNETSRVTPERYTLRAEAFEEAVNEWFHYISVWMQAGARNES